MLCESKLHDKNHLITCDDFFHASVFYMTNGGNKLCQLRHVWKLSSFFLQWKAVFTHPWIEELDHKGKEKLPAVLMRLSCQLFFSGWETVCQKLLNFDQNTEKRI